MPTRRNFELIVVTAILIQPAMGLIKMWAHKRLATGKNSGLLHGTAEIVLALG